MINRIVIGTANFGSPYGVANKRKLSRDEVFEILNYAHVQGAWGVDTAKAYGDAENVIGEFFAKHGKVFKVITKFPKKEYKKPKDVEDAVFQSLKNMNIGYIDFILLHSYETYELYKEKVIPVFQSLCRDKVIGCYGISVYHPEEGDSITGKVKDKLAVEFPVNIFDQRFLNKDFIQRNKSKGNFLFARSVFLQGLFFLNPEKLDGSFTRVREKIEQIRKISEEYDISPECMALLFAFEKSEAEGVIIGVDNKNHLVCNAKCFSEEIFSKYKLIKHLLADLAVYDEDVILPYKWKVAT